MGCAPQRKTVKLPERTYTDIGQLRVTLVEVKLPEGVKKVEQTAKVRVTNQYFTSKLIPGEPGVNPVNESYAYYINSFYQDNGRPIEVGLFEKDKLLAFGATDANPVIERAKEPHEFRVMLTNDKHQKMGTALLRAVFQSLPFSKASFLFKTATIRRKGDSLYAVKTTIAEETLQTDFKKDSEDSPPIWNEQPLSFVIPEGVETARVELVDEKDNVVGQSELNLNDILSGNAADEYQVVEELFMVKDKQKGTTVDTATLRFNYILGDVAEFSQVKNVLKSSIRGLINKKDLEVAKIEQQEPKE